MKDIRDAAIIGLVLWLTLMFWATARWFGTGQFGLPRFPW